MTDKLAAAGVGAGITLFGLSLTEVAVLVQILAGLAASAASIAALVYYRRKSK